MSDEILRTSLLDLLYALGTTAEGILLAGGYGLYLKQLYLSDLHIHTLINAEVWPEPRATQDIDLMLSAELVASAQSMAALRAALDKMGYTVVKGSEFLQFVRTISGTAVVKVDLLTAQFNILESNRAIRADDRRARPASADHPDLHAHPTDGALALTDDPLIIDVAGTRSDGRACSVKVTIPHPFNYLLMKLTAYRDRRNDSDKNLGRHHALDVFRIVAMLTESEWDQMLASQRRFTTDSQVLSCRKLVQSDFSGKTTLGVLAMRAHPLWRNDPQLPVFLEALHEVKT